MRLKVAFAVVALLIAGALMSRSPIQPVDAWPERVSEKQPVRDWPQCPPPKECRQ